MKTTIVSLSALSLIATSLVSPTKAKAATCTISTTEVLINGGNETGGGVPNYAQSTFEPGTNDCSPTAIGMVLGYWDANGWPCLMPSTGPYTGGAPPHASIRAAVEHFKTNLNYSSASGTWHTLFDPWGGVIHDFVTAQDSGASGWYVPDDFMVSEWDVTSEIDSSRPVVFSVMGTPGKRITWNSPNGGDLGSDTLSHSMAALGYRRVVEGDDFWGGCVDWLDFDEFYIVLRSGWQNGGSGRLYYHWDLWNTKTAVKVEPSGSSACAPPPPPSCTWPNDNECDEPEGTNLCAEGSDVNDCYCPWANDGECDEPSGLNLCPWHSDGNDCP